MNTFRPMPGTLVFLSFVAVLTLLFSFGLQPAAAQPVGLPQPPVVSTAVRSDVSRPLRDAITVSNSSLVANLPDFAGALTPPSPSAAYRADGALQTLAGTAALPTPSVSFDGASNLDGYWPPSPSGDVGPNHYVLMTNIRFAIYNKTGGLLYGPVRIQTIWTGFGGPCETTNGGTPIVLYDQLADRWLLSQTTYEGPTYYLCVALSTGPDPIGTYYRYAFSSGASYSDLPRYAVWPQAYFASAHEMAADFSGFTGVRVYAFDRAQMLAGNPSPRVVSFFAPTGTTPYNVGDGLLPADLEGNLLPPPDSPGYFLGSMDNDSLTAAPQDALTLWKFKVDFDTPANSKFTLSATLPVAAFDSIFPCTTPRNCIPQPNTSQKLEFSSGQQLDWRVTYRNFGSHESLTASQSVEASLGLAGIRWYELRNPGGAPVVYQQGTYAPGASDGVHRWMGSLAMDQLGNLALGYSASDGISTYPSIRYTGRLAGDALGQMTLGEGVIIDGLGAQTNTIPRWGSYSSMTVDPVDGCTFWYANEYYPTSSAAAWRVRVGAFKYEQCYTPVPLYLPVIVR
ncbi:MAG: hypothetical protein PHQ40_12400 [Anaerolineaceae bacterium]|nr:hypothetical protein [Anaerolineaceae bacterium]